MDGVPDGYGNAKFKQWYNEVKKHSSKNNHIFPLFRGQSSSSWELKTTLERYREDISLRDYMGIISQVYCELKRVKNFSGKLDRFEFEEHDILNCKNPFETQNVLDYLIFLRHYGFPSPLLDWSSDPYIAAFFAFNQKTTKDNAAIYYSYVNSVNGIRGWSPSDPHIIPIEQFPEGDTRHKNQKAHYTVAIQISSDRYFCSHESVFDPELNIFRDVLPEQDLITKIEIQYEERNKILEELYNREITAWKLFHNEESFLSTQAYKAFNF